MSFPEGFGADVSFHPRGEADISEHKDHDPPDDTYASENLVDHYIPKIELRLSCEALDEDQEEQWGKEQRITLSLCASHIENAETGRAFHTGLEVALNRQEAQILRDALSFMLEMEALA